MSKFEYFRSAESKKFLFYQVPQLLFTDNRFRKLSSDAKILYGILLNMTGLSEKNRDRFIDEDNKIFVYFTREKTMEMMNCGKEKSASMFQQLEEVGLIKRKRQGLGKPTKIYVMDFSRPIENPENGSQHQEVGKTDIKRSEKPTLIIIISIITISTISSQSISQQPVLQLKHTLSMKT